MKQNNGSGSVSIFPLPGLSVGETVIEQDASTAPTRIIDSTLVPHTAFAKALKRSSASGLALTEPTARWTRIVC
jgi:hypothetical protein